MTEKTIHLAQGITGEELMAMKGLQVKVIHGRRHIMRAQEKKQHEPEPEEEPEPEPKPKKKRGPKPGIERKNYIVRQSKMNDD